MSKSKKNSEGLDGIRTHDPFGRSAPPLHQLRCQAKGEQVFLRVNGVPIDFFACWLAWTPSRSVNTQKKLGHYPAVLTSRLVNNPYILATGFHFLSKQPCHRDKVASSGREAQDNFGLFPTTISQGTMARCNLYDSNLVAKMITYRSLRFKTEQKWKARARKPAYLWRLI